MIKLRPTINPDVGKFALVLIPTLYPLPQAMVENGQGISQGPETHTNPPNNHNMNFVILNCRGARSPDFQRNFRSLLDYHHPSLVVLLETHLDNHLPLRDDFSFTNMSSHQPKAIHGELRSCGMTLYF